MTLEDVDSIYIHTLVLKGRARLICVAGVEAIEQTREIAFTRGITHLQRVQRRAYNPLRQRGGTPLGIARYTSPR